MLATCCTHCGTRFRVTAAQLQARQGQVRCGRCHGVFDALQTLGAGMAVERSNGAVGQMPESVAQPDHPSVPRPVPAAEAIPEGSQGAVPDALPAMAARRDVSDSAGDAPASEIADVEIKMDEPAADGTVATAADAMAEGVVGREGGDSDPISVTDPIALDSTPLAGARVGHADDQAQDQAQAGKGISAIPARTEIPAMDGDNPFAPAAGAVPPARRRHPILAAGTVLLLLLVAAQALYFYRSEIAARFPVTRDLLAKACEPLRCHVSLPRRPEAVVIEASDLQATDASAPGRIRLTATLRNHAAYAVAFPALDLVLTNANDHTLARRVFLPAEYLDPASVATGGLAPKAEATVRLTLDTSEIGAAGFRLAVLAAPLQ